MESVSFMEGKRTRIASVVVEAGRQAVGRIELCNILA